MPYFGVFVNEIRSNFYDAILIVILDYVFIFEFFPLLIKLNWIILKWKGSWENSYFKRQDGLPGWRKDGRKGRSEVDLGMGKGPKHAPGR